MRCGFSTLVSVLSALKLQVIKREGDPLAAAKEAQALLRSSVDSLDDAPQTATRHLIPEFARSVAVLLKNPATEDEGEMAFYRSVMLPRLRTVFDRSVCSFLNVNDTAAVVHCALALADNSSEIFKPVVASTFNQAYEQWRTSPGAARTDTTLTLLRAAVVKGAKKSETQINRPCGSRSLLPYRTKTEMELNLHRCPEARHLLHSLREKKFARTDAGICLGVMASHGVYDADLASLCCEVLNAAGTMLTSRQFAKVVYCLGTLGHRTNYERYFAEMVHFNEIDSDSVRHLVVGQAMLQLPVKEKKTLFDGLFLHLLRPRKPGSDWRWALDCAHGLHELHLTHYKFILASARFLRHWIYKFSNDDLLKGLFVFGGHEISDVPEGMQPNFAKHVSKMVEILKEKCKEREPETALQQLTMTQALLHAGSTDHVAITKAHQGPTLLDPIRVSLLEKNGSIAYQAVGAVQLVREVKDEDLRTEDGRINTQLLCNALTAVAFSLQYKASKSDFFIFDVIARAMDEWTEQKDADSPTAFLMLNAMVQLRLVSYHMNLMRKLIHAILKDLARLSMEDLRTLESSLQQLREADALEAVELYIMNRSSSMT